MTTMAENPYTPTRDELNEAIEKVLDAVRTFR
jgi:hypothetical protein